MKDIFFKNALVEIAELRERYPLPVVISRNGENTGQLLGFALDSETLHPQAILKTSALKPQVLPASDLKKYQKTNAPGCEYFLHEAPRVVRHRKGGIYTRVDIVFRGVEEMIFYISHADHIWWVRPRTMFEDGRFQNLDGVSNCLKGKWQ